jgi:hypothetical protein
MQLEQSLEYELTIFQSWLAQHKELHVKFKADEYEGKRDDEGADTDVKRSTVNRAIEVVDPTRRGRHGGNLIHCGVYSWALQQICEKCKDVKSKLK